MQFFWGWHKTKTRLLFSIMSDHCKRNFRPEMRKMFIEGYKTIDALIWDNGSNKFGNHCLKHTAIISQNFVGEWNMVCSATAWTKTALDIIQLWFNYFPASFFKARDNKMLIIWKFPKSITDHMWHAGRVFETLALADIMFYICCLSNKF